MGCSKGSYKREFLQQYNLTSGKKKKIQTPKAVRIEQATFKVIYRKQIIKDQSRKKSRQSKLQKISMKLKAAFWKKKKSGKRLAMLIMKKELDKFLERYNVPKFSQGKSKM